jgi:hypothetical protein
VIVTSAERWLTDQHGISSLADLTPATWLTLSEQRLLETTAGRIFRDDLGTITTIRLALAWYPEPSGVIAWPRNGNASISWNRSSAAVVKSVTTLAPRWSP